MTNSEYEPAAQDERSRDDRIRSAKRMLYPAVWLVLFFTSLLGAVFIAGLVDFLLAALGVDMSRIVGALVAVAGFVGTWLVLSKPIRYLFWKFACDPKLLDQPPRKTWALPLRAVDANVEGMRTRKAVTPILGLLVLAVVFSVTFSLAGRAYAENATTLAVEVQEAAVAGDYERISTLTCAESTISQVEIEAVFDGFTSFEEVTSKAINVNSAYVHYDSFDPVAYLYVPLDDTVEPGDITAERSRFTFIVTGPDKDDQCLNLVRRTSYARELAYDWEEIGSIPAIWENSPGYVIAMNNDDG